ncbi:MAG TPA: nucleoside triphosphate pyrophosphatase [Candidatus Baltobacteraceae bacterium]
MNRELSAIVLASASPRRLELLASLGVAIRVWPSNVEEGPRPGQTPEQLAASHASAKADAAAIRAVLGSFVEMAEGGLIVAADTVVDVDGTALGKPRDAAEATRMLTTLSGRTHVVHTAFVVIAPDGRRIARSATSQVTFTKLDAETIAAYVATGEPFDKAGGYGVQGRGAALVERIDGDFYTVMGFPLGLFVRSLPELGYRLPERAPARLNVA